MTNRQLQVYRMLRMAAKLEQMGDKQEAKRLATAALKLNSKVG